MSILSRSGNLSAAKILHNRIYILHDMQDNSAQEMKLVLFDDTAFLDGEKLYFVYYDRALHSIHYSFGKGAAYRAGELHFSNDFLMVSGMIQDGTGQLRQVMGSTTQVTYAAQVKKNGKVVEEHSLTIGARTDETSGMLQAFYELDGIDISDTTACVKVNPVTWETTIIKNEGFWGISPLDSVSFEIVIDYRGEKFTGTYKVRDIGQEPKIYDFVGKATVESLKQARAIDREWKAVDGEALEYCPHPNNLTQELRQSCVFASEPELLELINISPVDVIIHSGGQYTIDRAQQKSMEYFQNILVSCLDKDTIRDFFGSAPALTDNVARIKETYKDFYQKHALDNMAQILYDNCRTTGSDAQKKACERIKQNVVKENWSKAAQEDPDYQAQANALYLEGYRDGVPSIAPFLKEGVKWAKMLYDHLTSPIFLNLWRVQIASLVYDNVRDRMYGFYSKLLVLDSSKEGEERANKALNTMLSVVLTTGGRLAVYTDEAREDIEHILIAEIESITKNPEKLPDTIKQYAELYQEAAKTFITTHFFVGRLVEAIAKQYKKLRVEGEVPMGRLVVMAGNELAQENTGFRNIWEDASKINFKNSLASLFSAATAGFMIYSMVKTAKKETLKPEDIVEELSMGELALLSLIKGSEYLMETQLGKWITKLLSESENTFLKFAESFSKWFTKEGIAADHIFARLFGKSSRVFCQRILGPAVLLTAIVLGGYLLADAIKIGDTKEIVLEALNLVCLVGELVSWGLAMSGFSWAGPLGTVFMVVGIIIIAIQVIWEIFDPPKGPVEEYVDNKLVPAGLATA